MKLDASSGNNGPHRENGVGEREARRGTVCSIPNLLSALRLMGSPVLIALAGTGWPAGFLTWFGVLVLSDWLDGKLATRLRQATTRGARLDSLADATFYFCVLVAMIWLRWDVIRSELLWIGIALASYLLTSTVGFVRFRRLPSYHTRMAKASWLLVAIAVVALVLRGSPWPLRIAMAAAVVTNCEATAISLLLDRWRVNVSSLYHALRIRRASRTDVPPGTN
jgi:CDP-diacylglycerol--glycerol-3-phosphate 3-phosphatidyltransferase